MPDNVVTPSQLRADIYRLIDRVLETGEPLSIDRRGRRLHLVPEVPTSKLSTLTPLPGLIIGDPDDLISVDWSGQWDPDRALMP